MTKQKPLDKVHKHFKRACGVFLIVCDGTCSSCELNNYTRGITNGNTICEFLQSNGSVGIIAHRTDPETIHQTSFPDFRDPINVFHDDDLDEEEEHEQRTFDKAEDAYIEREREEEA